MKYPKFLGYLHMYLIFVDLPRLNNHPNGENSPNLITLSCFFQYHPMDSQAGYYIMK
jgi:hypothetical protein